ncbi:thioredoxin family protein [Brumimicrobium aurantiacum]|uniref:Thioredoxin family protein n=1 Tax=Brumimicrobium aurantiacum TaxID=1737063 RepID=A0A3E1EWL2_9FLAO|nr:thioredoxin family protein [Brumimicrobium aurantiacum]RFC53912.1 thioredoxin family protein [Brumimicrobium aurantiacum]
MKNTVTWEEYLRKFEDIENQANPEAPYDNPDYYNYFKLNKSRQKRWLKTGTINAELTKVIAEIKDPQTWYLITEPWCGDAAHNVPFIYLMSKINPNITLKMVWRDTAPYMIENYLTNGGKSIPKLVIRDEAENDLHVWGPRPAECQSLFQKLKDENADFEKQKIELQNWYNKDKGESIQSEFLSMLK